MFPQCLSSSVSACTLLPQCWGSPCGSHAFIRVCLNLCQSLFGGKNNCLLLCFFFRDTDYISMSSRPSQARQNPWGGGHSFGLSSPALWMLRVMHCGDRVILHNAPFCTKLFLVTPLSYQSEKQLAYLLTYLSGEASPFFFRMGWKKESERERVGGSQGERLCCLRSWQCSTGSFTHFLLEMIFWHLLTDPLKMRLKQEKPFRGKKQSLKSLFLFRCVLLFLPSLSHLKNVTDKKVCVCVWNYRPSNN